MCTGMIERDIYMGCRNLRHILKLADFVSNLRPTIHIKVCIPNLEKKCVQAITDGLSGKP